MSLQKWIFMTLTAFAFVAANTAIAEEEVPEIERDIAELEDMAADSIEPPGVETALVFSNTEDNARVVVCHGRNANGVRVGGAAVRVPGHGVRHLLAADLSDGAAFAGQAVCHARGRIVASGFAVAGAGLTDIPVRPRHRRKSVSFRFPIVATR